MSRALRPRRAHYGPRGALRQSGYHAFMAITYALEPELTAAEFRAILVASTLAERRPAEEPKRLELMLRRADIIVTARDGSRLVGISRAITDFAYCCYLS